MNTATTGVDATPACVKLTDKDIARFWAKVDKNGPIPDQSIPHYVGLGPCWIWTASLCTSRYGLFRLRTKIFGAHRISWVIKNDIIPPTFQCLHRCDNRQCVNPQHLFLGKNSDNVCDRVSKKRFGGGASGDLNASRLYPDLLPRGIKHGMSKLNDEVVNEIRTLYKNGSYTYKDLGGIFGVHPTQIMNIVRRFHWKHIP